MSGEEQEQLKDYLELEDYIQELQADHVAHPPKELTPDQARIYLMAVLFHSTSHEASELRQAFVDALQLALEQELQQMAQSFIEDPYPCSQHSSCRAHCSCDLVLCHTRF